MRQLKGLGGAPGVALGTATVKGAAPAVPPRQPRGDPAAEAARLEEARRACDAQLAALAEEARARAGDGAADILEAYRDILGDDLFFQRAADRARAEGCSAAYAVFEEMGRVCAAFDAVEDDYLRARASDIENVCRELIAQLRGGGTGFTPEQLARLDIVLAADELTPADTMRLEHSRLRALVTQRGGLTSHTVILARTLGIPAVVGAAGLLGRVEDGAPILVDGDTGIVTLEPDEAARSAGRRAADEALARQARYAAEAALSAVTLDGLRVRVNVNTGDRESLAAFDPGRCDGVGLLRTEFLYLEREDYPGEELQFEAYRALARRAGDKEVVIRTLDIGGDKRVDYLDLPREDNPFLGCRAIRLCLDRPAVFHTQLRAILRASAYGNVKIMFPMIVTAEELEQARAAVRRAMDELDAQGIPYRADIPVGIMVETPAAVLLSDLLARRADFFSIGSNDLIQYTTATDRLNQRVQYLYESCNLSVLRAIRQTAQSAHAATMELLEQPSIAVVHAALDALVDEIDGE